MKFERLGDIAELIAGQSPPSSSYNQEGVGLPFFQGKADYGIKFPTIRFWCSRPIKVSLPDDILISMRAPVGPVNINNVEACIGRGLSAIRVNENINRDYIYFWLKLNEKKIADKGTGTTFKAITQKTLSHIQIPVPSLAVQTHVAQILSKIETTIEYRKQAIVCLDEFIKNTFLKKFGDTATNRKKWSKVELKHFGNIITGNTPPRDVAENYNPKFIEWIKTDNILTERTYITTAVEYLSEKGLKSARTVSSGALLVACIAGSIESVGRAALTDRTVAFNQQINAIQPNNGVSSMFLYWMFKISKKYVQDSASSGMKKILTKGSFEKIKMMKPPFELQMEFEKIVEKAETLKTIQRASLHGLEKLYASLSQQAFNGELKIRTK